MRIAYLTQSYSPMVSGAAIVAEQLAGAMADRGHQVLVIAASETGQAYLTQKENLSVLRLASFRNPMRVEQRLLQNPRRALLKALREFKPDLIHSHEPLQLGWLGLQYARQAGIPATLTTHQLPWFAASYLPNRWGLRRAAESILWRYAGFLIRKFTAVISPTRTVAGIIQTKTNVKPRAIPFGINLKNFRPSSGSGERAATRAALGLPLYAPIIVHVGRLDIDKSVDRVIRAAADSIRTSNAELLIVGDGCEKPALLRLCKALGIAARVHFTGFVSNKERLANLYRAADVFITASQIETQGIVILEAAASGLPIVAVNATCIPEVVQHGRNGYLAAADDPHALSDALGHILQDVMLSSSMARESRLVAERYDLEHTFSEHEKIYASMIMEFSQQQTVAQAGLFHIWRRQLKQWGIFGRWQGDGF